MKQDSQKGDVADLVERFFETFGRGDRGGMLALFAPDVDLLVPGSARVPWTGARSDPGAVKNWIDAVIDTVDTQEFVVDRSVFDENAGDAVIIGRFAHLVRSTGKVFRSRFVLWIGTSAGRIVQYHMYEDSFAAHEAFG